MTRRRQIVSVTLGLVVLAAAAWASGTLGSIQLTWEAGDSRALGYRVFYATQPGGPWDQISTRTQTSFRHTGVAVGGVHYYGVVAYAPGLPDSPMATAGPVVFPLGQVRNLKAAPVRE